MKEVLTMVDFDKKLKRAINDVKRGIRNLRLLGLKIESHEYENILGKNVSNVYVTDNYVSIEGVKKVILQKYLLTIMK
jgi:hypothetical protein